MYTLGVIPARGGSKGIPRKNVHPLCGKPLIRYTVEAALSSGLDGVVVSTDDTEIASFCLDVRVRERPAALARDDTPMLPVIVDAVQTWRRKVDAVMVLQPTSPLRTAADIDECLSLLGHSECVVSVCAGIHPKKHYDRNGEPFLMQTPYDHRRDRCFVRNGAIFALRRSLLDAGRLFNEAPTLYEMPKLRSVDIDDCDDLTLAATLLSRGDVACPPSAFSSVLPC